MALPLFFAGITARSRPGRRPPLELVESVPAPESGFCFPASDRSDACLLIHGSTGHPGQLRLLGEQLHVQGYGVLGMALPGHGVRTTFDGVGWESCYAAVRDSWQALRGEYRRVHVIGFSLGGALALHLAAEEPVDDLVLLAPALFVHFQMRGVLVLLHGLVPGTPARAKLRWYAGLQRFFRMVARDLERVRCPLLAIHARDDRCIRMKSSLTILERMAGRDSRLTVLPRGGHLLTVGEARDEVWREVSRHLAAHRVGPQPAPVQSAISGD
jgi:carboxylesterase